MFLSVVLKKSCLRAGDCLAGTIQSLFVSLVFTPDSQDDKIRPFLVKIQLIRVSWSVKFGVFSVTFVEIPRDDVVLSTRPLHAKARILL